MNGSCVGALDRASNHSIYDLVAKQAQEKPDGISICAPGRTALSYRRLLAQMEYLANALGAIGLGRNDRVALVLPNGPEMATAFLGAAVCATSAPLNPAYRAAEFDFCLSHLGTKALVIDSAADSPARDAARARGIPIVELTSDAEGEAGGFSLSVWEGGSGRSAQSGFASGIDVALVLHTSGTTSRPKIVPLSHTNICTSVSSICKVLELHEGDRCLNIMPLFHVHGLIAALLSSLASGSSVICTPGLDPRSFFEWSEEFRPTWYSAVPTMHRAILDHATANPGLASQCRFRFIRSATFALPPQTMAELERVFGAPVIESYGMTEASPQITSNPLPPRQRKPGSVGLAAGPEVAVVNEAGDPLPPTRVGQIVIRGANVTDRYEGDPEANRNAFINGWFRTGDQGYLDSEGYLFITGRLKEIINRGGQTVSPREVDEVLIEHPDIVEAATFGVPHPSLGEEVVAAVVLRDGASVTRNMIRGFARGRLAEFKVPSRILIVDSIARNATGKLQRISLAEAFAERLRQDYVPPREDLETRIAAMYSEVLALKQVGTFDNFFALGGDSLHATRLRARLRAELRLDLSITALLENPTVAELAEHIARCSATSTKG